MKLAIFSALPQELKTITENIKPLRTYGLDRFRVSCAEFSSCEITAVETGVGVKNSESALTAFLWGSDPDVILSAGFGGALYSGARAGELVWASKALLFPDGTSLDIPDVEGTFKSLQGRVPIKKGSVITLRDFTKKSVIINRIPLELPFPVCDMETYPLASIAARRGIPFIAVRSITDAAGEELPFEPRDISDEHGFYSFPRALKLLLRKPGVIPGIIRLGRSSKKASRSLWSFVRLLAETLGSSRA
jgi:adenosylhomocysteine nucleosidase